MKKAFVTMDQAFDYVGDNSRYQQRITLILSYNWIFYSFFVMGMPIILENPIFFCGTEQNLFICTEQQICGDKNVSYTMQGHHSIAKEFELYCSKKYILGLIASLFFIGQSFGGIVFPILANYFGRKWILLFGSGLGAISIIFCGLISDIYLLMLLFFIAGFGLSGYETVVYVYITEISASRFRSISSNVLVIVWGASMLIFPSLQVLLGSWRQLLVISIGVPMLLGVFASYLFYVESPRWLASKQRYDECRQVFKLVSIYNKRKPFDFNFIDEIEKFNDKAIKLKKVGQENVIEKKNVTSHKKAKSSYMYLELFRHGKLTKITLILMLSWFLRYFTYFGIQFSLQSFGIKIAYALMFVSLAEVLAAVISSKKKIEFKIPLAFFKLRFNRISSIQTCLVLITACCLFYFLVRTPKDCFLREYCVQEYLNIIVAIVLKFATTFYITTLNTYTGEVYPTSVRSYGYGICMTFGQIGTLKQKYIPLGSSLVPIYVQYMVQTDLAVNPLTNISLISILVFLPETFKKEIYDDIQEEFLETQMFPLIPLETEMTNYNILHDPSMDKL